MTPVPKEISDALRRWQKTYTLAQLGELIGVSSPTVGRIVRRRAYVQVATLEKLQRWMEAWIDERP